MPENFKIGRGVGSGLNGEWRAVDINWDVKSCVVYLEDYSVVPWDEAPEIGVQVIVTHNGIGPTFVTGYDEYIYNGVSKYGTMINNAKFQKVDRKSKAEWLPHII